MQIITAIDRMKYDIFCWRCELSIPWKITLAIAFAVLTGLAAQLRFYLPFSPVPFTGQTFAVLLAGVMLGRWWGGASMAVYATLGFAGVPWFNGLTSGVTATGGYIIGFILAALFIGHLTDKYIRSRSIVKMLGIMLVANFGLIYIPGLVWLGFWMNSVTGGSVNIAALLAMGATPFIIGDVVKAVLAAVAARTITPEKAYNGEVNAGK
jgi:biotin transport system substrate-specific component